MRKIAAFLFIVVLTFGRVASQFALPIPNEGGLGFNVAVLPIIGDCDATSVFANPGISATIPLTPPFTIEISSVALMSTCGSVESALFWYGNSTTFFYGVTVDVGSIVRVRTANGGAVSTFTIGSNPVSTISLSVSAAGTVTAFFTSQASTTVLPSTTQVATGTFPVIANAIFGFGAPVGFATGGSVGGVSIFAFNGITYETRVWNFAKNLAAVQADVLASVSGKETGLTHLWRFRGSANADLGGVNFGIPGPFIAPIGNDQVLLGGTLLNFVSSARVSSPANQLTRQVFNMINNDIQVPLIGARAFSTNVAICNGNINGCTNFAPILLSTVGSSTFTYTTEFIRASCTAAPKTVTLVPLLTGGVNGSAVFSQQFIFEFPVTVNDITVNVLDTTSPIQVTSAVQIGLSGVLANGETVSFTLRNTTFACTISGGAPNINGVTLTCDNFGLPGEGNVTITLCERTLVLPFAFPAPEVISVAAVNDGQFNVTGRGFGNTRTGDPDFDVVTLEDGTSAVQCDTIIESDTRLVATCDPTKLTIGKDYTLVVAMGGSGRSQVFSYEICVLGCQNGGVCVARDKCECPVQFQGDQCQTEALNVAAIAVPVAVGGTALIVASIVGVIAYRRYKNPKRGGKTFVPLEKKDFTKIIYGDTLLSNPSGKAPGDLLKLETTLLEDNLELAFAIANATQITEADEIAKAMVTVFQANNKVLPLLKAFVGDEVRNSDSAGTLFRSNSFVSKMFKYYSRLIALPYLYTTIGPEINELLEDKVGLEVDPEKIEEGTDLDQMRWTLMAQSQKILKQIMASNETCPNEFKVLFGHLKECVSEKFPEHVNITIGGFIFLRFFCPAISSPEAYGLSDEPPSQECRRLLILITKVLQNLSNDVEFGSKEMYMTKMNDFIQVNRGKISAFYKKLIDAASDASTPVDMPRTARNAALHILGNHLKEVSGKFTDEGSKKKANEILN